MEFTCLRLRNLLGVTDIYKNSNKDRAASKKKSQVIVKRNKETHFELTPLGTPHYLRSDEATETFLKITLSALEED